MRLPTLSSLLPVAVGLLSLLLTAWSWHHEQQSNDRNLRANFDFSLRQAASRIEQRMASYEQMLRGAQGLFKATDNVDADSLGAYVDALLAGADVSGLQLIAHAPLVPARDLQGLVAAERGRGAAGYDVRPSGPRELYAPVTRVAPATSANLQSLGEDVFADPLRRAAMLQAQDSGNVVSTARLTTPSDTDRTPQYGFVMFLPLYVRGAPVDTAAARRTALAGWVFARVRMSDPMTSLYGEETPGIAMRIHDGVAIDEASLMYDSSPGTQSGPPRFEAQEYIELAGHTWTLSVATTPAFEQRFHRDSARIIAVAGIGLSLLLALLTQLLVTGRARAHMVASAMTSELRHSEARYRRIVETAAEGIWMTDAAGRISFVNPKLMQMLGYGSGEMIGQPLADFSDDLAGPDGEHPERLFRRKGGGELWVSMSTSAIEDGAGRRQGTLAMVTDVTARRQSETMRGQLEAQLRESQKMEAIGTLAGGIAHDFNNILAAILGNVALAQQQLGAMHAAMPHLEQVARASARARGLVHQILAFSRRQPHRLVPQALRPLIEESTRLLRPLLPARVAFETALSDAPLYAAIDATQLQQVVMNLCTNAWHALDGRAGRITLGLDEAWLDAKTAQQLGALRGGRYARFWVADNGCGMDEATRARLFEPFYTTKPVGQGTGLGLSVVHGIVATHQGAITVDSTPGHGSRFDVLLPLVDAPAEADPPAAPVMALAGNRGQRVMYIDDDPIMLLMVQGLLQGAGYRISGYDDPRAALDALRAEPGAFDVIVTDYNMPMLSGLDVALEARRVRAELPVVITSGYFSDEVRVAAAQAGVRGMLQKEYTLEQLGGLVERVLGEQGTAAVSPDPLVA